MPPAHKVFLMVLGNTLDHHKMFMENLKSKVNLHEVNLEDDCDFIIAFVPIVSRAGTDIQAAVEKISNNKPVILVVLHHTFDPNYLPPDSKLCVKRNSRVFAVDCLFHEDKGLLISQRNSIAIIDVKKSISAMQIREEQYEVGPDQDDENQPLIQQRRSGHEVERQDLVDRKCFLKKVLLGLIVLCIIVSVAVGIMVDDLDGTPMGIYAGAGVGAILLTIVMIVVLVKYKQAGKKLYLSHTSH
ncbi:uncharacterized protein LOC128518575 [Clarias gariepinus]|uniref:uncharacterized protein LOC128518575 n=1 Tax=Clarias gariepinus TaxID=13013 RepID=UPI00234CE834|nr:uncharacterized protein LOC128518575 [Clarias gariepinus]